MRRVRGCGGRFANTKKQGNGQSENNAKAKQGIPPLAANASSILNSDSASLNSSGGASSVSGCEAARSMYTREHIIVDHSNHYVERLHPSPFHSHINMIDSGQGTSSICSRWDAAADGCCDLKVWRDGCSGGGRLSTSLIVDPLHNSEQSDGSITLPSSGCSRQIILGSSALGTLKSSDCCSWERTATLGSPLCIYCKP